MQRPDLLRPTLKAGLLFGVLSALPGTNIGNCCCCLWMWGCGWLAAFLFLKEARQQGYPTRISDGAMAGLLAGLFAGFTDWVGETLKNLLFGERLREMMLGFLDKMTANSNFPPEFERLLDQIREGMNQQPGVAALVFSLILTAFLFALLSTLAGTITAALMSRGSPLASPPPPGSWQPPSGYPPSGPGTFPPGGPGGFPPPGGGGFPPPGGSGGFPPSEPGGFTPGGSGGFPPAGSGGFPGSGTPPGGTPPGTPPGGGNPGGQGGAGGPSGTGGGPAGSAGGYGSPGSMGNSGSPGSPAAPGGEAEWGFGKEAMDLPLASEGDDAPASEGRTPATDKTRTNEP